MPNFELPPRGVFVPIQLVYGGDLPPTAVQTWMQLRGLAWRGGETPLLSMQELSKITGKSPSSLYSHLTLLRDAHALSWRPVGDGRISVTFPRLDSKPGGSPKTGKIAKPSQRGGQGEMPKTGTPLPEQPGREENYLRFDPKMQSPAGNCLKFDPKLSEPEEDFLRFDPKIHDPAENCLKFDPKKQGSAGNCLKFDPKTQAPEEDFLKFDPKFSESEEDFLKFDPKNQAPEENFLNFDPKNSELVENCLKFDPKNGSLTAKAVDYEKSDPRLQNLDQPDSRNLESPKSPSLNIINHLDINPLNIKERTSKSTKSQINKTEREGKLPREAAVFRENSKPPQPRQPAESVSPISRPPQTGVDTPESIYLRLTGYHPSRARRDLLRQVRDLQTWQAALQHWLEHGWNPLNIAGQIELYERGGPKGCRCCGQAAPKGRIADENKKVFETLYAELNEKG